MENEKSDIKKGWVTGSIDLGKLNKAHQRFSFNELNPKTLNKFKKDLRVLLDDDFIPRTLDVFQTHPLLRFIIPVLKGKLQTDYLSMELFIEMALLLSEYPLLVDKDLISHINTSIYDDYEDVWKSIIKLKDCGLLNELTIILRKYSEYKGSVQKAEKDSFECLSLISKKELFAITYKELHINEAIYENRVCCYFYSFKLGSLILYPFVDTYCKAFVEEEHPSQRLYNELCVKGDVAKVMTASGKISREAVLERIHLPIALCYIIALDKLTASEVISEKWILNNVSSQYVNAFRLLWWECSVCARYSEVSGHILDFEKRVQRSLTLAEMETGEKLTMPDDYFAAGILSKAIEESSETMVHSEIPNRIEKASQEQPNKTSDDNVRKVARRGRPVCSFRDCFCSDNNDIQNKYIDKFKVIINGKRGKKVGYVIAAAYALKILKTAPSFKEVQKELGDIGAESGYKKYKQNPNQEDQEYKEIKERLLQLKEEIESGGNAK
ncbi:hypothetical protein [uncultured Bacteroides sp.]|uniref:hypothetical protein n=1 Tax=uncultured Bacteroides sp. TaxID=162156 RepID=UPI00263058CB|nr:hypothetical protein [uncultured Bacteroides sp.]